MPKTFEVSKVLLFNGIEDSCTPLAMHAFSKDDSLYDSLIFGNTTQKSVSTSSIEFTPATKQSGLVPFGSFANAVPLYHIAHK